MKYFDIKWCQKADLYLTRRRGDFFPKIDDLGKHMHALPENVAATTAVGFVQRNSAISVAKRTSKIFVAFVKIPNAVEQ